MYLSKVKRKKKCRLANHHRFCLESENGLTIFPKQVNAVMFNHYSHLGIVHIILSEVSQQPQTKKLVQWLVTQFSKKIYKILITNKQKSMLGFTNYQM